MTADEIIREVAARYGVLPAVLKSKAHKNALSEARCTLVRLLRQKGLSCATIGRLLGGRTANAIRVASLEHKRHFTGIHMDKRTRRWRATVERDGQRKQKFFDDYESALAWRNLMMNDSDTFSTNQKQKT